MRTQTVGRQVDETLEAVVRLLNANVADLIPMLDDAFSQAEAISEIIEAGGCYHHHCEGHASIDDANWLL
jgi:hypothetical protein